MASARTLQTYEWPLASLGRSFYLMWFGQLLSTTGSGLTSFGLSIWLFQRTGSVLDFSRMILFTTLPGLLVTPWAGSLADRYDRRILMMAGDSLAALCTALIGGLVCLDRMELWHLYALEGILSIGAALVGPAANAAITMLVPRDQFGRATGMFTLSGAIAQIGVPLMAGVLGAMIGLQGIIVIDLLTFGIAIIALSAAAFPSSPRTVTDTLASGVSVLRRSLEDSRSALAYLWERRAMAMVYGYSIIGACLMGFIATLVTPMILSIYNERTLAFVLTSGSAGALLGGLVMTTWGDLSRRTAYVFAFGLIQGFAVAIAGKTTSVSALCICSLLIMLSGTLVGGCITNLWRRKVPADRQGGIFALQQFAVMSSMPLSVIVGGALVHHVFEPALMPGGWWFDTIGSWFGTGKGRGIGFFFSAIGCFVAVVSAGAMNARRLQRLEQDVPDTM